MGRGVELILRIILFGKACDSKVLISKVIFLEHSVFFFFKYCKKDFLTFFYVGGLILFCFF
jgi:hypothetical protein